MATIKELAAKCGVSIGTVDRVLHNRGRVSAKTRELVLSTAEEMQYIPNRAAQSLAARKKKFHLGFIAISPEQHPFFADVNNAALQKAEELKEFGVTVSVFYYDFKLQQSNSRKLKSLPSDDFDINSMDGIVSPGPIDTIIKLDGDYPNIPVAYYNFIDTRCNPIFSVGCDYFQSGAIAAGLCALAAENHAKIAIISEGKNLNAVASCYKRIDGFCDRMSKKYPECEIVGPLYIYNDKALDKKLLHDFFQTHSGISAVYLVNPGNYDVCLIIREMDPENRIRIITNDLVPVQKEMIRNGIISATITQEPERQGAMPLDVLFRYLAFGEKPEHSVYYTKLDIRIASNID